MSILWLLAYASLVTAVVCSVFVFVLWRFYPEFFILLGSGAGQKNISWFPALIFNPFFESIVLAFVIKVFVKLKFRSASFIVAALIISLIHFLQNILWGLTILTFFLIQSYAFYFTYKTDFKRAFLLIWMSHVLHNLWILSLLKLISTD